MSTCEHGLYPGVDCKQRDAAYDAIVKAREAGKKAFEARKYLEDTNLIANKAREFRSEWIDPDYCETAVKMLRADVLDAITTAKRDGYHQIPELGSVPNEECIKILAFIYQSFADYCSENKC